MNDEEESEIIPFSSSRSTPPGRLTLNQYTDVLSKKISIGKRVTSINLRIGCCVTSGLS